MSDIKLSPKHGMNPTIPVCFWCGEDKEEIALLGKIDKEDSEAPKHMVLNYEPCDKCKEFFNKGIQIIGCEQQPLAPGQFPIMQNEQASLYPTGITIVVPEDWMKEFLKDNDAEDIIDSVIEARQMIMANHLVHQLIQDIKELEGEEELQEETTDENN